MAQLDDLRGTLKDIVSRLEEIEKWRKGIKILVDQSKKPYECPVCKGYGKHAVFAENRSVSCNACDAKGIVWG